MIEGGVSLQALGRSRRRLRTNRAVEVGMILAAGVAIAVLALLVGSVLARAIPALNLNLITTGPSINSYGEVGGGISARDRGDADARRSSRRRSRSPSGCSRRST